MLKKRKFLVGGIILFVAIGFLGVKAFDGVPQYDVGELLEQGDSALGQRVQAAGQVAPGSVEQELASNTMKFTLTEAGNSLPVVYRGAVPDAFKAGNDVVVEGELGVDGVFQANTLMVRCASKYVPEE